MKLYSGLFKDAGTVTHIDGCECATCRATELANRADELIATCQKQTDQFLAKLNACIVIPFPVRRTRGYGGSHERS